MYVSKEDTITYKQVGTRYIYFPLLFQAEFGEIPDCRRVEGASFTVRDKQQGSRTNIAVADSAAVKYFIHLFALMSKQCAEIIVLHDLASPAPASVCLRSCKPVFV